jgi:mono/diheme cytochrome c family protein
MAQLKYVFNETVLLIILLGVIFLGGCELKEGWPWFRNMYDSQGPQPQEEALALPEQSLPTEGGELDGFQESEGPLINPEVSDPTVGAEEKGKVLYDQYCTVCHGESSEGRELTEDYFTPDLTEEDYLNYSDEELYDLIVEGGAIMPNYREELTFRERWLVISHLKTLQKDNGR